MEPAIAVHVPQMESADTKPSKAEILRGFINKRLTTAAQEIFAVVERTITGYEEETSALRREFEQQRKQMETVVQPQLALCRLDQLGPLLVCGGAEVPEEAEQRQHTHAAGSQDASGHKEEAGGDCEEEAASAEEPSQGSGLDRNPLKEPGHLIPNTGAQSVTTTFTTLDPLNISVCLLDPIKLQTGVLKSSTQVVKCPRGMKEDDFLARLRSTFPQLTRPFEAFTVDGSRTPRPLKTESLTPENIYKSMESADEGGSTLYIHLKAADQQQGVDETRTHGSVGSDPVEKVESKDTDIVSISSGTQQVETDDDGERLADYPDPAADSPASPGCSDGDGSHGIAEDGDRQNHDNDQSLMGGATNTPSPLPASSAGDPSRKSGQQDKPSGLLTCSQPSSTRTQGSRQLRVSLLKDARISALTKTAAVSSQSFLGHTEEKGGNEGVVTAETAAQSPSPDQDTRKPAQLIPPRRDPCVRTRVRKSNHLSLRVCLMKDLKSRTVKSPIRVVRCFRNMTEDHFLARLRSTFPQFTRPFEAFTTDASKKLLPLTPKTLTPENIYKSIKSTGKGRSALYIRLQQTCERKEKIQQDTDSPSAATSVDSAADGKEHHQERDKDHDGLFLSSVKLRKQVKFRVRLLKDKATDVVKKGVVNSAVRKLNCPRGMDEDAFLKHLRSTFPRLTGPFDAFTTDASRKLIPLKTETLTPENIYMAIRSAGKGRSALYLRAKPAEKELCPQKRKHEAAAGSSSEATNDESGESKSTCSDPVGNKEADTASSSSARQQTEADDACAAPGPSCGSTAQRDDDQNLPSGRKRKQSVHIREDDGDDVSDGDLDDDWKPDGDEEAASSTRTIRRPLHIRVCLLKGPQTNTLSKMGYKCRVQKVRCPRGLRQGSFLDMLRSSFPNLPKGNWPFDAFLTDKHRRLKRLEVKDMTPEEIYRSMKSSGNGRSALYIRLKLTKPWVNNEERSHPTQRKDDATSDPLSCSNSRDAEDEPHTSSTIGPVRHENSSEDLQLQIQAGGDAQESPSVSIPPSAPESDGDEVERSDRDVDWKPNQNDEEQEQNEPDGDSTVTRKRPGKRSKTRKSASMKSPPETTAEGFYSCRACGSLHKSVNILLKHAWSHVNHSEKLCGVCGAPADDAEELRRHLDGHMKTHTCSICGKYFLTLGSLKKHGALHTSELTFKCDLCPKAYTSKHGLMTHSWTHMESKPYRCDVCHQSFVLKAQMEAHVITHTGEKPYRCQVCGKTFTYFKCLSLHRSVHTSQKCHPCQVCGKSFKRLVHLKAHERTHTARDKSFLCDVCCKTFFSIDTLKAHLKTHGGEKTLCSKCGKGLSSVASLKRHMIIHSGERPYSCSTCGRAFNARSTLRAHMRTHTGEKRFICKVCGRASSRLSHLQIHMRTHNGERPYKCSVCPKDFTQSHCLKSHMKSHHVEGTLTEPRPPSSTQD